MHLITICSPAHNDKPYAIECLNATLSKRHLRKEILHFPTGMPAFRKLLKVRFLKGREKVHFWLYIILRAFPVLIRYVSSSKNHMAKRCINQKDFLSWHKFDRQPYWNIFASFIFKLISREIYQIYDVKLSSGYRIMYFVSLLDDISHTWNIQEKKKKISKTKFY